jgi:hypothetical protein
MTAAGHASGCVSNARFPATRSRPRNRTADASRSSSRQSHASSSSSTSPAVDPIAARSCSRTAEAGTYAARTGAGGSGSPPSSVPAWPTSGVRHTCATLLLYEGRTLNEVAEHLGHADPGFTARTYAHVMRDASRRRRITISEAILTGRTAASRRPLVDPSGPDPAIRTRRSSKKSLEIERADARTRTGDPFITSEVLYQLSYVGRETQCTAALIGPPTAALECAPPLDSRRPARTRRLPTTPFVRSC